MANDKALIHNAIRDKVISLLLDKICVQHKELSHLKEENAVLKSDLTSLYKKMIIFKSSSASITNKRDSFKQEKNSSTSAPSLTYTYSNRPPSNQIALIKVFSHKRPLFVRNQPKAVSRNKPRNNHPCYSSHDSLLNDNQSQMLSTNDKISTSKVLSNASSKGAFPLSPKRIDLKVPSQKTYRSTKLPMATEPSVKFRSIEQRTISRRSENKKKRIKVCVNNTYKWDPLSIM